jgi:hypothetical protein
MQIFCKRVSRIDKEPDVMLLAESHHFTQIHTTPQMYAMRKVDLLLVATGRIIVT